MIDKGYCEKALFLEQSFSNGLLFQSSMHIKYLSIVVAYIVQSF